MTDLRPLDSVRDLRAGWQLPAMPTPAAATSRAELVLNELPALLPSYALAFDRGGEGGACRAVVLLGEPALGNVYLDPAGRWQRVHVPSACRGFPFALIDPDGEAALAFDHGSGLYRADATGLHGARRFFTALGELTTPCQRMREFLLARSRQRALTRSAAQMLAEAGLLRALASPVVDGLDDILQVDEAGLGALAPDTLSTLQRHHALGLAYAQLFSLRRLRLLKRLCEQRREQETPAEPETDLFGDDEDVIRF